MLEDLEPLRMPSNEGLLDEAYLLFKVGLDIGMGPLKSDSVGGLGVWMGLEGGELTRGWETFLLGGDFLLMGGGLEFDRREECLVTGLIGLLETDLRNPTVGGSSEEEAG